MSALSSRTSDGSWAPTAAARSRAPQGPDRNASAMPRLTAAYRTWVMRYPRINSRRRSRGSRVGDAVLVPSCRVVMPSTLTTKRDGREGAVRMLPTTVGSQGVELSITGEVVDKAPSRSCPEGDSTVLRATLQDSARGILTDVGHQRIGQSGDCLDELGRGMAARPFRRRAGT